jgi:hypothetical protein
MLVLSSIKSPDKAGKTIPAILAFAFPQPTPVLLITVGKD